MSSVPKRRTLGGIKSQNWGFSTPRITQNLPLRSHHLSPAECFRTFVKAIFYVGKGTRARPYWHFTEALSQHRAGTQRVRWAVGMGWGLHGVLGVVVTVPTVLQGCPKVQRILEIWASGQGVVSVLCFQNSVPAEAYTRESCLVEALGEWDPWGGRGAVLIPCPNSQHYFCHCPHSLHPSVPPCAGVRGTQPILGDRGTLGSPVASAGSAHNPPNPHFLQEKLPRSGCWWGTRGCGCCWGAAGGGSGADPLPAGLQTITNQRKGNCYGTAASWPAARRQRLGVHMLHRALRIFLAEGERQLRPHDIPGGAGGHPLPAPPLCYGQKGGCAPGVAFKS